MVFFSSRFSSQLDAGWISTLPSLTLRRELLENSTLTSCRLKLCVCVCASLGAVFMKRDRGLGKMKSKRLVSVDIKPFDHSYTVVAKIPLDKVL